MSDDKLRQELLYMVKLTSKYNFSDKDVVETILRMENDRAILTSVFGKRFKSRIFDIAYGQNHDSKCVICGLDAQNGVICKSCLEKIGGSVYAKSKEPEPKKNKNIFADWYTAKKESKKEKSNQESLILWPVVSKIILVGLIIILALQLWILGLWISIPDRNPTTDAVVSQNPVVTVSSEEEAYEQLILDFPQEDGWTVTYGRTDVDYVGRFLLSPGDCINEVEENLSENERYDYFFQEQVYVFYVSYLDANSAKVGVAEVNTAGHIIVMGQFNDGRKTDSYYLYR